MSQTPPNLWCSPQAFLDYFVVAPPAKKLQFTISGPIRPPSARQWVSSVHR